eukprot:11084439-Alexandrium_andersonii.AAC.1
MAVGYSIGCRALRPRNMRHNLRRSKFEVCGPKKSLKIDPGSPRGVRSAPLFAQRPNLPTKRAGGRTG